MVHDNVVKMLYHEPSKRHRELCHCHMLESGMRSAISFYIASKPETIIKEAKDSSLHGKAIMGIRNCSEQSVEEDQGLCPARTCR